MSRYKQRQQVTAQLSEAIRRGDDSATEILRRKYRKAYDPASQTRTNGQSGEAVTVTVPWWGRSA